MVHLYVAIPVTKKRQEAAIPLLGIALNTGAMQCSVLRQFTEATGVALHYAAIHCPHTNRCCTAVCRLLAQLIAAAAVFL